MSPYKSDPTISKPLHTINAPMILGAPQRLNSSNQRSLQVGAALVQATSWDSKQDNFTDNGKRNKSREKGGKGLRHFSMKVCEKVQKKGVTSYNEVADELVGEFSDSQRCRSPTDLAYDQKNIRRRVYDALNVLMAMNIISKEKKEIKWLGLPTNSAQDCIKLEQEKIKRLERIRVKTQQVQELILQHIAYKNLITRNGELEKSHGNPSSNSTIQLPFIIVNTDKETVIDCSISADKMEYLFNFDNMFQVHDDIEILKRMGLAYSLEKGQCSEENYLRAKKMIPKALENYVKQIYDNNNEVPTAGTSKLESNLENEFQKLRSRDDAIVTDSDKADSLEGRLSRYSSSTSLSDAGSAHVENAISDEEDFSGSPLDDED